MLISKNKMFVLPAFPIDKVIDPTGAGDTFAGGFIGYLASQGKVNEKALRQSLVVGATLASFNVQNFSLNGMLSLTKAKIKERIKKYKDINIACCRTGFSRFAVL